jgi:hypothetical protein
MVNRDLTKQLSKKIENDKKRKEEKSKKKKKAN